MISFSASLFPSLYLIVAFVLGIFSTLVLLVWLARLLLVPQKRQDFTFRHKSCLAYLVLLQLPSTAIADTMGFQQMIGQIAREIAPENQPMYSVLQETTLAGMVIPAGSKLQLLNKYAVGKVNLKPEYFETAEFPKAVMWQGVPIKSMYRNLNRTYCDEWSGFDNKACNKLPEEQRVRITWGGDVRTVLSKPTKINGFYCKDEVWWSMADVPQYQYPEINAAKSAPLYVLNSCTAATNNEIRSQNGLLYFKLPENSDIGRMADEELINGYPYFWTATVYGKAQIFNLFTLKAKTDGDDIDVAWDWKNRNLLYASGDTASGTEACPLPSGSYIEWHASRPDTLAVYSKKPVTQCGSFRIMRLDKRPDFPTWMAKTP
ncbi:hypothetical protein [Neisseria sp.]|uniref:hypothetical protein n=1 Tax=Neisseria sp. TaxID=192066 RepID=UPI00359F74D5